MPSSDLTDHHRYREGCVREFEALESEYADAVPALEIIQGTVQNKIWGTVNVATDLEQAEHMHELANDMLLKANEDLIAVLKEEERLTREYQEKRMEVS
jgi:hypothetical protein